jgi:hypothetical protein
MIEKKITLFRSFDYLAFLTKVNLINQKLKTDVQNTCSAIFSQYKYRFFPSPELSFMPLTEEQSDALRKSISAAYNFLVGSETRDEDFEKFYQVQFNDQ